MVEIESIAYFEYFTDVPEVQELILPDLFVDISSVTIVNASKFAEESSSM